MEGEAVREFLARNALGGHVAKIVDELCYGNDDDLETLLTLTPEDVGQWTWMPEGHRRKLNKLILASQLPTKAHPAASSTATAATAATTATTATTATEIPTTEIPTTADVHHVPVHAHAASAATVRVRAPLNGLSGFSVAQQQQQQQQQQMLMLMQHHQQQQQVAALFSSVYGFPPPFAFTPVAMPVATAATTTTTTGQQMPMIPPAPIAPSVPAAATAHSSSSSANDEKTRSFAVVASSQQAKAAGVAAEEGPDQEKTTRTETEKVFLIVISNRYHTDLHDPEQFPRLHSPESATGARPLVCISPEFLGAKMRQWCLHNLIYGQVNFLTGHLTINRSVHSQETERPYIMCPMVVSDDRYIISLLGDDCVAVLFRVAHGVVGLNRHATDDVVPTKPTDQMMWHETGIQRVMSRASSMCLLYDRINRSLVCTPQGLLVLHKRKEDTLFNLYLVAIPKQGTSAKIVEDRVIQLHTKVVKFCEATDHEDS